MSRLALQPPIGLTAFHIKLLAAFLMLVDHIGVVLDNEWLRILGRFSFPLFVWLLVTGAKHTKNWQRYQQRLLILAIASQPVYAVFISSALPLNPVFQLWLGLILVRLVQKRQITPLLSVAIIGIASLFFVYHYYGIGLIYLMSSYPLLLPNAPFAIDLRVNVLLWLTAMVGLHLYYGASYPLQLFALPVVGLMPFLNKIQERGALARWFYWFYPAHFVPLILLKVLR